MSPFQAIVNYEKANKIPLGYINYSISKTSPNGTWHQLERGEIKLNAEFFRNFKADLENQEKWRAYHEKLKMKVPPMPEIDAEKLFWAMMSESRHPDPYMFPALRKLKACGKFTLAALSNTVIFPPGSPVAENAEGDLSRIFDVFVSSAHVGMRKPDPRIYEYAMERVRAKVGPDLKAEEVLFLDDIGENLKAAKALGMRTIRVLLGKTDLAVKELGSILQIDLLDDKQEKARL